MNIGKHLLTVLLTIPAFLATAGAADETQRPRQLKSGIVEYTLNTSGMGSTQTGTKTEWFDDYGNRTATLEKSTTSTKIFGSESTEVKEELTIMDGDTVYTIDLRAKTGTKADIGQMKQMGLAMANRMGATEDPKKFVEKNGGKWLPAETFLGRKCDVVEMMGVKTWTYKGVTLKTEGSMMGITTTQVAKKFEENVSVPASKFAVPAGINFETQEMPAEAAAMMQALMGGGADNEDGEMPASLAQLMQQAQDESEDEGDEDDGPPSTLPLAKFKQAVAKVQVPGYQRAPVMTADGDHGLILVGQDDDGYNITAQRAGIGEKLEKLAGDKLSRFKHKGHDAFFARITDEEGEEMAFIVVKYPEYNMGLFITAKPVVARAALTKVLAQIEL